MKPRPTSDRRDVRDARRRNSCHSVARDAPPVSGEAVRLVDHACAKRVAKPRAAIARQSRCMSVAPVKATGRIDQPITPPRLDLREAPARQGRPARTQGIARGHVRPDAMRMRIARLPVRPSKNKRRPVGRRNQKGHFRRCSGPRSDAKRRALTARRSRSKAND